MVTWGQVTMEVNVYTQLNMFNVVEVIREVTEYPNGNAASSKPYWSTTLIFMSECPYSKHRTTSSVTIFHTPGLELKEGERMVQGEIRKIA